MDGIVLVLGAGGVRGWAHVGVLKALHEAGVPIAAIVGASAGALVGPMYAARRDVEAMLRLALSADTPSLTRWFLDGLRIAPDAAGFGRQLWQAYGPLTFQELAVPFAAAVLDVAAGRRYLVAEGKVGRAVEASIRSPVLCPPVWIEGRPLVDGGLHDTVPVGLARRRFGDGRPLVAVAVGEFFLLPAPLRPLSARVGRRLRRLGVAPASRLGQAAFMARLLALGRPQRPRADLVIRPNLRGISAFVPLGMARAVRQGEEAARAALPAIRRLLGEG
jgi:NTE family protein